MLHAQESPGWASPPNGTFPQQLTLRLHSPAKLYQLQLLSHEYKIAGKVEIHAAFCKSNFKRRDGNETSVIQSHSNESLHSIVFDRLGFMSFDSNEKTKFSARELKSVSLPGIYATHLRFIFHRCHSNIMNVNNQISLIMVELLGEVLPDSPSADPLHQETFATEKTDETIGPKIPVPASIEERNILSYEQDLKIKLGSCHTEGNAKVSMKTDRPKVDSVTAQRIAELEKQKAVAVAAEDYDEAKRLKIAVEELYASGAKIAELEEKKTIAVAEEDYDLAKSLKIELERMRHRAFLGASKASDESSNFGDKLNSKFAQGPIVQKGSSMKSASGEEEISAFSPATSRKDVQDSMRVHKTKSQEEDPTESRKSMQANSLSVSECVSHDEKPVQGRGNYDLSSIDDTSDSAESILSEISHSRIISENNITKENHNLDTKSSQKKQSLNKQIRSGREKVLNTDRGEEHFNEIHQVQATKTPTPELAIADSDLVGSAPQGFPKDLPSPDPPNPEILKELSPLCNLAGQYVAICFRSKSWQLREAALYYLAQQLKNGGLPELKGNYDALKTLSGTINSGMKDRLPGVTIAAMELLCAIAETAQSRDFTSRDLHAAIADLIPLVAGKAANASIRIRNKAIECLVYLSKIKFVALKSFAPIFIRPIKRGELAKCSIGRVKLIEALLPHFGLSSKEEAYTVLADQKANLTSPNNPIGNAHFNLDLIMKFLNPALTSANSDLRSSAAEVVISMGCLDRAKSKEVIELIPKDINPKLKDYILSKINLETKPAPYNVNGFEDIGKHCDSQDVEQQQTLLSKVCKENRRRTNCESKARIIDEIKNKSVDFEEYSSLQFGKGGSTSTSGDDGLRKSNSSTKTQQNATSSDSCYDFPEIKHILQSNLNYPAYEESQKEAIIHRKSNGGLELQQTQEQEMHRDEIGGTHSSVSKLIDAEPASPNSNVDEYSLAEEDPRLFETELRNREAKYGKHHPSVAEAAANLAIIYSHKGETSQALSLYYQALKIYEKCYGPNHAEVAHCLTDIAVILLEGGRDLEGKKLLQRAYDIQVQQLGSGHPDVVAIADVLTEGV